MVRSLDLPTGIWFIPRLDQSRIASVLFARRNPSIISKSLAAHSLSKGTKGVPERRRILVLETPGHSGQQPSIQSSDFQVDFDSIRVESLARAVYLLLTERFDSIFPTSSGPDQSQ